MVQEYLFEVIPHDKYDLLSKDEVVILHREEEKIRLKLQKEVEKLRYQLEIADQKQLVLGDEYVELKSKIFGKSSEKSKVKKKKKNNSKRGSRTQLPSERYPNVPVIEKEIKLGEIPACSCCNSKMSDSGMWETSEFLNVIPKKIQIIRQKRKKYCCNKCYGDLQTTPAPPRILPGSNYHDDMFLDVALSKYLDLIPIDRYAKMLSREDEINIPPNSLINLTHYLADFFDGAALKCKEEVKSEIIVKADETPHRMLEDNDNKDSWFLWGFSSKNACYFDIKNTRSGDVASDFLKDSSCIYLMSDVFSGYKKAVRVSNEYREENNLPKIIKIYCNAHARRNFKKAENSFPDEAEFFIRMYRRIYWLEKLVGRAPPDKKLKLRKLMMPYALQRMYEMIIAMRNSYSKNSTIGKAMKYFFDNYDELTLFTTMPDLPIDNNSQEALLRSPVVGRKTWYGTHSKRGAETAATHFTLIESCKLNKVNPRKYYEELKLALLRGDTPFTPSEFKNKLEKREQP